VNNGAPTTQSSSRLRARLRAAGAIVLLLGLTAAGVVYWVGTHGAEGTDERLLEGPSRAERHQIGLLYGRFGLRIIDLMNGLKDPGAQAVLISVVSIAVAVGCFYLAGMLGRDDDTR